MISLRNSDNIGCIAVSFTIGLSSILRNSRDNPAYCFHIVCEINALNAFPEGWLFKVSFNDIYIWPCWDYVVYFMEATSKNMNFDLKQFIILLLYSCGPCWLFWKYEGKYGYFIDFEKGVWRILLDSVNKLFRKEVDIYEQDVCILSDIDLHKKSAGRTVFELVPAAY